MDNLGFFRICAATPEVKIADSLFNAKQIVNLVESLSRYSPDCIVMPELCITAYTCADLFQQKLLMDEAEIAIAKIAKDTACYDILLTVGAPVIAFGKRYNCAILIYKGQILGIIPKSFIPNYNEFYEKRWFTSGKNIKDTNLNYAGTMVPFGTDLLFQFRGAIIGVEICEDLWVPQPPSCEMAMAGANIILNLSASNDLIGKHDYLISLIRQQSARCRCAYAYSSAGWGESSTDLVFTPKTIIAEDGDLSIKPNNFKTGLLYEFRDIDIEKLNLDRIKFDTFVENEIYAEKFRFIKVSDKVVIKSTPLEFVNINPKPFVPNNSLKLNQRCMEITDIQSYGLMKRLYAISCKKALVGISGGLDSTLALLVTVKAFDRLNLPRTGIIAVTMPGVATTSRTKNNAIALIELLGVTLLEIPIGNAVSIHFKDIDQDPEKFDATYENSQARERTQILMDLANKEGGIVIGTGDMSELALGWCTYNGDQMSMYGVNASVPKTLVKYLVDWFADNSNPDIAAILKDISDTPISPELVPSNNDNIIQKTEDLVGPYELHDFFLYNFLRNSFGPIKIFRLAEKAFEGKFDSSTILKWFKVFIKRFFSQQFKRSCMPDGPKVGSVNLSPRGDWRMPSDASPAQWLKQLQLLEKNET